MPLYHFPETHAGMQGPGCYGIALLQDAREQAWKDISIIAAAWKPEQVFVSFGH